MSALTKHRLTTIGNLFSIASDGERAHSFGADDAVRSTAEFLHLLCTNQLADMSPEPTVTSARLG